LKVRSRAGMPSSTVPEKWRYLSNVVRFVYQFQGHTECQSIEFLNQHPLIVSPGESIGFKAQEGRNPIFAEYLPVRFQFWHAMNIPCLPSLQAGVSEVNELSSSGGQN
jgi:hypothetical protein